MENGAQLAHSFILLSLWFVLLLSTDTLHHFGDSM
jgi:hypothetical protein